MNRALLWFLASTIAYGAATTTDLKGLIADRTAVERVYYNHRLGTKRPFDEALPAAEIERQEKTEKILSAAALSIPKRSFEPWLGEQKE